MKEQLERLIQQVQETHLIERLVDAKSLQERVKICEEAKKTPEFQEFMDRYGEVVEAQPVDVDYMVSSDEFTCTKENAVAIAVIFIIEGIDDIDMFDDDGIDEFFYALMNVKGAHKKVAQKIVQLLGTDPGCESSFISDFNLNELLERIF